MKNLIYTFAFIFTLSAGNAFAQERPVAKNLDSKVTSVTRTMASELGLNEMEYIKLKDLNRDRLIKQREIRKMYSNDQAMLDMKMNELGSNYEAELNSFLTDTQREAYATYKADAANYTALTEE